MSSRRQAGRSSASRRRRHQPATRAVGVARRTWRWPGPAARASPSGAASRASDERDRRGAVVDAARVAGGDGAVGAERRPQPGQPLGREPGAGPLVAPTPSDRDHLGVEPPGRPGRLAARACERAAYSSCALPAHAARLRQQVVGQPHVGVAYRGRREGRALVAHRLAAVHRRPEPPRRGRRRLDPAGEDHAGLRRAPGAAAARPPPARWRTAGRRSGPVRSTPRPGRRGWPPGRRPRRVPCSCRAPPRRTGARRPDPWRRSERAESTGAARSAARQVRQRPAGGADRRAQCGDDDTVHWSPTPSPAPPTRSGSGGRERARGRPSRLRQGQRRDVEPPPWPVRGPGARSAARRAATRSAASVTTRRHHLAEVGVRHADHDQVAA